MVEDTGGETVEGFVVWQGGGSEHECLQIFNGAQTHGECLLQAILSVLAGLRQRPGVFLIDLRPLFAVGEQQRAQAGQSQE